MNRIREIRLELDALMRELGGDAGGEESPEKRRAAFRIIRGGLILVLVGASLGVAHAAGWTARHARTVAAGVVTAGVAGVIAGAVLAHGSPPPHSHPGAHPRPIATVPAPPNATSPAPAPIVRPKAPNTPTVPVLPVLVPARGRRSSAAATAGSASPRPSPAPSRPSPAPSGSSPPLPTPVPTGAPTTCPVGLSLEVLGLGVYVCV